MIYCHTMAKAKVAVTIDARILGELDALIAADRFPNRSQAVEAALADKINRLRHTRLAREAAKLDVRQEQAEADEGLAMDAAAWPQILRGDIRWAELNPVRCHEQAGTRPSDLSHDVLNERSRHGDRMARPENLAPVFH